MNNPSGAPECFGSLWSDSAVECKGGYDPGYNGMNGSRVRPRCDFFDSCKSRVTLKKLGQQPQLMPPQSLIRPQGPFAPAVPYQNVPGRPVVGPIQPQQQVHPGYYPQVTFRPIEMMPASYHMPAYLSEPEVRLEGESYWAPMGREILRGLGKALGHSVAHFFDHVAFTRKT